MNYKFYSKQKTKTSIQKNLVLSILNVITIIPSTHAAIPIETQKTNYTNLNQLFNVILPSNNRYSTLIEQASNNLGKPDTLTYIKQVIGKNNIRHIRLQQEYLNYPVYGGYTIFHIKKNKDLTSTFSDIKMNGKVYQNLSQDLGTEPPYYLLKKKEALQQLINKYQVQNVQEITDTNVTPMIYIDSNNKAHWAYKVSILVHYLNKIPARPTAIIDAKTFRPYLEWDNIKKERSSAQGMGFGGNPKIGKLAYGKDYPLLEISRESKTSRCYLENSKIRVVDMKHKYKSTLSPMSFRCPNEASSGHNIFWTGYKNDGYDRSNGAYSPANDALYSGQIVRQMYKDWYGIEVLTTPNGSPLQLIMCIHYGQGYANAFWDGTKMTFGDGDFMLYPLVSLSISSHEISHGFTEQHANLEYYGQSGGMNESFSDMAAQAAEYYATGTNSWLIGSEIFKENSGLDALRYMQTPSFDGLSIDSADQYYKGIEVHFSSGVYNRLFYLLAHKPGWNTHTAFDVMVIANMYYWTPYSTFEEGACAMLNAANNLHYPLAAVKESLDEVAIQYKNCMMDTKVI